MAFQGMDYWSVYKLPVTFRKYLIKRYNERQEQIHKSDKKNDQPLMSAPKNKVKTQQKLPPDINTLNPFGNKQH